MRSTTKQRVPPRKTPRRHQRSGRRRRCEPGREPVPGQKGRRPRWATRHPLPPREVQAHAFALRFASASSETEGVQTSLPASLFAAFIDVGHYKHGMAPYRAPRAWRPLGTRRRARRRRRLRRLTRREARALALERCGSTPDGIFGTGGFRSVYARTRRDTRRRRRAPSRSWISRDAATFGATPEGVAERRSDGVGGAT